MVTWTGEGDDGKRKRDGHANPDSSASESDAMRGEVGFSFTD